MQLLLWLVHQQALCIVHKTKEEFVFKNTKWFIIVMQWFTGICLPHLYWPEARIMDHFVSQWQKISYPGTWVSELFWAQYRILRIWWRFKLYQLCFSSEYTKQTYDVNALSLTSLEIADHVTDALDR
jgi:hypothetical protein